MGRALRIGMFTNSYKPYTSGVVRSLETFKEHLQQMGHSVYIFAPGYGTTDSEPNIFRYHSIPAPTARGYYLPIPLSWRTKRCVRDLELDIIHVHAPFLLGRLGLITGRRLGIPVVFTYHTRYDLYTHYAPIVGKSLRLLVSGITTRFGNRCNAVITPTPSIQELLIKSGVKTPISVVPTGVDPEEFKTHDAGMARERFGLAPEDLVLVTVGRLGKEKNLEFLLEVMLRLPSHVRLLIVGDGPLRATLLSAIKRMGLNHRVILTGQLRRDELASTLWASHLFVFSSTTDTQGVVLLEARMADLPIVALDATGARDLITDAKDGFLVKQHDPDAFAERIRQLITDEKLRQSMIEKGRHQVTQYSAAACAHRLAQVYETVIAAGGMSASQ